MPPPSPGDRVLRQRPRSRCHKHRVRLSGPRRGRPDILLQDRVSNAHPRVSIGSRPARGSCCSSAHGRSTPLRHRPSRPWPLSSPLSSPGSPSSSWAITRAGCSTSWSVSAGGGCGSRRERSSSSPTGTRRSRSTDQSLGRPTARPCRDAGFVTSDSAQCPARPAEWEWPDPTTCHAPWWDRRGPARIRTVGQRSSGRRLRPGPHTPRAGAPRCTPWARSGRRALGGLPPRSLRLGLRTRCEPRFQGRQAGTRSASTVEPGNREDGEPAGADHLWSGLPSR